MLPKEVVPFIKGLLSYGHWVEVVTNLTLTDRINELLDVKDKSILKHLLVKGSLHWKELKNKNLVDVYFENMCKVIASGASSSPFLVICNCLLFLNTFVFGAQKTILCFYDTIYMFRCILLFRNWKN